MPNQMSQSDASRVQSTQAKSGGDMSSSGFAARAQGAGDRNANQSGGAGGGGHTSANSGGGAKSSGGGGGGGNAGAGGKK
ncbi:hypothetical protein ANO11243_066760 [Dothideomycetidae sp. 11243]|nr:hypothetical protein ANO11243_066760 [fungal sp. No.11243]